MDSHYHILIRAGEEEGISNFIRNINGKSAILLNKLDRTEKRIIWYNYWDTCIRKEEDFWMRFNYIHNNPVKHGLAKTMKDYKFSSYNSWVDKRDREWMDDVVERYPVIDFMKEDE